MSPLTYSIQINADGIIRFKATVPATECGIVGDYYEGKPYQPDMDSVLNVLPYRYRKAFIRSMNWWQSNDMSGRNMPLMRNLHTVKGKPIGTIFATPNWFA